MVLLLKTAHQPLLNQNLDCDSIRHFVHVDVRPLPSATRRERATTVRSAVSYLNSPVYNRTAMTYLKPESIS